MDDLLEYLADHPAAVKASHRPNVASEPVKTTTLGIVNKRSNGFGISNATFDDKFALLRLVHEVAKDPNLDGPPPNFYTSVCLNVNYTVALHVDRNNYGFSSAIAAGSFTGGRLFVAEESGTERFRATQPITSATVDVTEGEILLGKYFCIKNSWLTLDGSTPHGVEPIGPACTRISLVFFCVPFDKVTAHTYACLKALGFPLPNFANVQLGHVPTRLTHLPPFTIFICSRQRSQSLKTDTLRVLLAANDDTISSAIVLCINEGEVADYQYLGFPMIVVNRQVGLPEQRQICLLGRPAGAWNLFLDDDVTGFHNLYSEMPLRELFLCCFLVCEREGLRLFGLNTSMDVRNLRANISRRLGLVNGYCFGIVSDPNNPRLSISDSCGGAAEDIERSLRYYDQCKGILRFNFATAIAKTRRNTGGLQFQYRTPELRKAAHEYVVRSLIQEFPDLIASNLHSPNAVTFQFQKEADENGEEDMHEEALMELVVEEETQQVALKQKRKKGKTPKQFVSIALPPAYVETTIEPNGIHNCTMCEKQYRRREDLLHHIRVVHNSDSIVRFSCRYCGRQFLKKKDGLSHERGQRCNSRRGKHKPIYEAEIQAIINPNEENRPVVLCDSSCAVAITKPR
jgi:hypothetical protein